MRYAVKSKRLTMTLSSMRCSLCALILTPGIAVIPPSPAHATPAHATKAEICDAAAQHAARSSDVPLSVLRAITRTETGRSRAGQLAPWPWTVNMEGQGKWFDTRKAARDYVQRHFDRGARSFDVGCFQINYRWHGAAFTSIDEMFDPVANARYAARFLTKLYAETGDWTMAAGAYHSRTRKFADRYAARFQKIHRRLKPYPIPSGRKQRPAHKTTRKNTYPLLQIREEVAQFGSLVPLVDGGRPALVMVPSQKDAS